MIVVHVTCEYNVTHGAFNGMNMSQTVVLAWHDTSMNRLDYGAMPGRRTRACASFTLSSLWSSEQSILVLCMPGSLVLFCALPDCL